MEEISVKVGFMKARKFSENRDGFCPAVVRSIPMFFLVGIGNGQSCGYQEWAIAYD